MDIRDFLLYLQALPGYEGQILHVEHLPPRAACYGDLARPLPADLQRALEGAGVRQFYSHQAEAINATRAGRSVIVATGTASGKTLCYNIPVLESILADPLSRALYLYPTKALAQDQLRALQGLIRPFKHVQVAAYDGDTPQAARTRIRKAGQIILSNPDMLNVGLLPNHPAWAPYFRHLKVVVLDEAHTYRGVFGSHIACLLRRLRRVCALYGAQPQFVLCSATIANPGEHANRLTGQEVVVVEEDGAPRGPREFVFWEPPIVKEKLGLRRSINTEATALLAEMVKQGLRNITFTRSRKEAELLLLYAREVLRRERPELIERIGAYRAGYLPAERREIERRLFSGDLVGIAATNALELGIDIGQLDATILVGYPGSIASTWQQAGRAGRGQREALSVLIGADNPLDQFFMRHPEELFGRSPEHALIDPDNPYVLHLHLPCAALEWPLTVADEPLFGSGYAKALRNLEADGVLQHRGERWMLAGDGYPAQNVNMRSASSERYLILDETRNYATLEETDAETAFFRLYPGAIYLHRAEPYLITRLDLEGRIAYARPTQVGYYTQPREINDVHIIRSTRARSLPATDLFLGMVRVTQQVVGYRRKKHFSDEVLTDEPLNLPAHTYETQALWFEVPAYLEKQVLQRGLDYAGGLHAVEHACIGILPFYAMCDRDDIGGLSTPLHPDTGRAQVFIYDAYPGGVGIVAKGFELIESLWQRTLQVVSECPCEEGCPSCIQSPKCGNNNEPLDKKAAIVILEALLSSPNGKVNAADDPAGAERKRGEC
jgi:DEAD/DEAH box helicase domain-containing protein